MSDILVSLDKIVIKDKYLVLNSLVVVNVSTSKNEILSIIRKNKFRYNRIRKVTILIDTKFISLF